MRAARFRLTILLLGRMDQDFSKGKRVVPMYDSEKLTHEVHNINAEMEAERRFGA